MVPKVIPKVVPKVIPIVWVFLLDRFQVVHEPELSKCQEPPVCSDESQLKGLHQTPVVERIGLVALNSLGQNLLDLYIYVK